MREEKTSSTKIVFWLLLLVFLWLAVSHFAKTTEILKVLTSGRWYWIIPAVFCQFFYYPLYTFYLEKTFSIFDVNLQFKNLLPIYIASKFTDVALPLSTIGKVALFIRNGKKLGQSSLNSGLGISFALFLEIASFAVLSTTGFLILYLFNSPQLYIFITLMLLILLVLLISLFLYRLAVYKNQLSPAPLFIIRLLLKLIGRSRTDQREVDNILIETGQDLKTNRKNILPALGYILTAHLINLLTLAFIFLAFASQINIFAILACYIAGQLFSIISITPQGIGVAETVMITTLHSFGLDISAAAVITLAYRGLLYWLPLFAGFYVFGRLELIHPVKSAKPSASGGI
jgi:hypothetical protein